MNKRETHGCPGNSRPMGPALLIIGLLALIGAMSVPARAEEPFRRTIREGVGVEWTEELIHYRLEFAPGELSGDPAFDVTVDGELVPAQVADVARYADGSLRACNVWFFVSLPAGGAMDVEVAPGQGKPVTGVEVREQQDAIELLTNGPDPVGIRLPAGGEEYVWPADAADVPGPIQKLRLPSGNWIGRGNLEVPFTVKSFESTVTERGPLFAEAHVQYTFDTGSWTFTARVIKDHPIVIIREELDTGWNEQDSEEIDRFYSFILNGGDFSPEQVFYTGRTSDGFHGLLKKAPQPEIEAVSHQPTASSGTLVSGYPLSFGEDRTDYYLIGWPCWSSRVGVAVRFHEPGGDAVGFVAMDTPSWRNQMSLRFKTGRDGSLRACLPLQVYEQDWPTDGYGRTSPNATGKTLYVPDTTARRTYGIMLSPAEDEKKKRLRSLLRLSSKFGAWTLDEVKDWTLRWPDPMADADWAEQPTETGRRALQRMHKWVEAKRLTGNFGLYSMHDYTMVTKWNMKRGMGQADLKHIIDDTDALPLTDRKKLRRLAAYQAYVMNSKEAFPWGTGAHLGNPNMSIMAMNARMASSKMLGNHPMFDTWGRWTLGFMRNYLQRYTRQSGAPYECPHYTLGVTLKQLAEANQVLMEAGIGDAFSGPLLKKSFRFAFNWLLPRDPRFNDYRTIMPVGNTSYQSVPPEMARPFVRYYSERDPHLAGKIQWFANQTLPPDKELDLVEERVPELDSMHYEDYGVFFRHGFRTDHENYFHMMAGNTLGHYEQYDQMSYTLYAKGYPINLHFGNGYFPMFGRPWLRNRVSVDHRREGGYERLYAGVDAAATSAQTDYVRASLDIDELRPECTEYPTPYGEPDPKPRKPLEPIPLMTWHRQVMFVKDQTPVGPNYYVIRDTFGGKPTKPTKPTDVSYWFLAEGMEEREEVFHFDGQLPVDMDVFVNTPVNPDYETAEFSHRQQPYVRLTGDDLDYYPDGKRQEKQLCLRLKQPPGEGYMVVLYPRLKEGDPPAEYERLGKNVVRVETPVSTDYVILNAFPVDYENEQFEIRSRGAVVREFKDGRTVIVNSDGAFEGTVGGKTITGKGGFTVTIDRGEVSTKTNESGATVHVQ